MSYWNDNPEQWAEMERDALIESLEHQAPLLKLYRDQVEETLNEWEARPVNHQLHDLYWASNHMEEATKEVELLMVQTLVKMIQNSPDFYRRLAQEEREYWADKQEEHNHHIQTLANKEATS